MQQFTGFPISPPQERAWMQRTAIASTTSCELVIEGERLDCERLERAFHTVSQRHEILRTVFRNMPNMSLPLQVIEPRDLFRLTVVTPGQETSAPEPGLDPEKGPIWCVHLVRDERDGDRLNIAASNLCVDRLGLANLVAEIAAAYAGESHGQAEVLQYADLAQWMRDMLAAKETQQGRAWWRKRAGRLDMPALPLSRPHSRPPENAQVKDFSRRLTVAETRVLHQLAERSERRLEDLMLACFHLLLARHLELEETTIGLAHHGRKFDEVRLLPGAFAGYLPHTVKTSAGDRFEQLLERVGTAREELGQHQEFFSLQTLLEADDGAAKRDYLAYAFQFETVPPPLRSGAGTWRFSRLEGAIDRFDLLFAGIVEDNRLTIRASVAADRYDDTAAVHLLHQYATLLSAAATAGDAVLAALSSASEHTLNYWQQTFNPGGTAAPAQEPLALIAGHGQTAPDRIALEELPATGAAAAHRPRRLTYRRLLETVDGMAGQLRHLGVGGEQIVAVFGDRSLEVVCGLLAVLRAGAAFLPLDPVQPGARLAFMLADAGVSMVLAPRALVDQVPEGPWRVLELEGMPLREQATLPAVEPGHLAYLLYTSGSTGQPKGTLISRAGLSIYLDWCLHHYQPQRGHGTPVFGALGFDATLTSLFAPLVAGNQLVLLAERDPLPALPQLLAENRGFSFVKMTPAQLSFLAAQGGAGLADQTHCLILGGEALHGEQLAGLGEGARRPRIINEYGPTEAVVGCCVYELPHGPVPAGAIPIGRPIERTRLYVTDTEMKLLPAGIAGELCIAGTTLARGYLGRPRLTAEKFTPDSFAPPARVGSRIYKSGDRAFLCPSRGLIFLGRADDQVKIRGVRVEPGEIEAILSAHEAVRGTVVQTHLDRNGETHLIAYVVTELAEAARALHAFLETRLPPYMIPTVFTVLDDFPLNAHGKVDRGALPVPKLGPDRNNYEAPTSATHHALVEIWQDILAIERIGIRDNFFAMGGHSLLVARMISQLMRRFQLTISPADFFRDPTIAALAEYLERQTALRAHLHSPDEDLADDEEEFSL